MKKSFLQASTATGFFAYAMVAASIPFLFSIPGQDIQIWAGWNSVLVIFKRMLVPILVSVGILKRYKWAFWACGIYGSYLLISGGIGPMLMGPLYGPGISILFITIGTLGLATFFNRNERTLFDLGATAQRAAKWLGRGILTFLVLWLGLYAGALLWLHSMGPQIHLAPRQFTCTEAPLNSTWRWHKLSNIAIALPPDQELIRAPKNEKGKHRVFWKGNQSGLIIILGSNTFSDMYDSMKTRDITIGDNSFDFSKKFAADNHGLIFALLKAITAIGPDDRIDEFNCNAWHGFVQSGTQDGKALQAYSLWHRHSGKTVSVLFRGKQDSLDQKTIDSVLANLQST